MAGGGIVRSAKTAIVRTAVPQTYRDIAAAMQLYGKSLDTRARGFPETADRMKAKAGDWAQGKRVQPGSTGNLSGNNSARSMAREIESGATKWPPTQTAEDITAMVSRNAAGAAKVAGKSLASTVIGDALAAAPTALKVAGRALPATAALLTAADLATGAIGGGIDAYKKGGDVSDIAKGAGWGAVNAGTVGQADVIADDISKTGSVAAGLEMWAKGVGKATLKTFGFGMGAKSAKAGTGNSIAAETASPGQPAAPSGPGGKMTNADRFTQANKIYAARIKAAQAQQQPSGQSPNGGGSGPSGNTKRGFQNAKNQYAAQTALQHNYSGPEED